MAFVLDWVTWKQTFRQEVTCRRTGSALGRWTTGKWRRQDWTKRSFVPKSGSSQGLSRSCRQLWCWVRAPTEARGLGEVIRLLWGGGRGEAQTLKKGSGKSTATSITITIHSLQTHTLKLPKGTPCSLSKFYLQRYKLAGAKSLQENRNDLKAEHTRVSQLKDGRFQSVVGT